MYSIMTLQSRLWLKEQQAKSTEFWKVLRHTHKFIYVTSIFLGPICFHLKQINLRQCRKNVHSSCANVASTALCLKQCRRYEGQGGLAPISVYSKFGTSRNDKTKDNDAKTNHNVQI